MTSMNLSIFLPMMLAVFGLLGLLVSFVEYFFPSKSRDQKGYRTKRSLYTQESWDFAQKYYAKMVFLCSLILLLLSFLSNFLAVSDKVGAILFGFTMLLVWIFIYFKTEAALRRRF